MKKIGKYPVRCKRIQDYTRPLTEPEEISLKYVHESNLGNK